MDKKSHQMGSNSTQGSRNCPGTPDSLQVTGVTKEKRQAEIQEMPSSVPCLRQATPSPNKAFYRNQMKQGIKWPSSLSASQDKYDSSA